MQKKIHVIFTTITIAFIFLTAVLGYRQIIQGQDLAQKAINNRRKLISAEQYSRGDFLDRNNLFLTDVGVRPSLVIFPHMIGNHSQTAEVIAKALELSYLTKEKIENDIRPYNKNGKVLLKQPFVLKPNLTNSETQRINSLGIPGVAVLPIKTRYGPGFLSAHVIGHMTKDNTMYEELKQVGKTIDSKNRTGNKLYKSTDPIGANGLEKQFEYELKGMEAEKQISVVVDAIGRLVKGLGYRSIDKEEDPSRYNIILTIDKRYQQIVEDIMDHELAKGSVVVIDIASGDILALASRPNFDPNRIEEIVLDNKDNGEFVNRSYEMYYPGSVFKIIVAIAALEEGLVDLDEKFICEGNYTFNDSNVISCLREHGEINLYDAFAVSCNSTFINLALRLGPERLKHYAKKIADIDIKFNYKEPNPADIGNASIGQKGVQTDAVHLANILATIARDGKYQGTRLVDGLVNSTGFKKVFYEEPSYLVMKPETAKIIQEMLSGVVERNLGWQNWLPNLSAAGKTGTAQNGKKYELPTGEQKEKTHAWFVGYAPQKNPRIAVSVLVEETLVEKNNPHGGKDAAPIFRKVVEGIFKLEGVAE